jgi:hypothetical protein
MRFYAAAKGPEKCVKLPRITDSYPSLHFEQDVVDGLEWEPSARRIYATKSSPSMPNLSRSEHCRTLWLLWLLRLAQSPVSVRGQGSLLGYASPTNVKTFAGPLRSLRVLKPV